MAAVLKYEFVQTDALIMSAAVSDFKVVNTAEFKIHKDQINQLSLSTNEDILNSIGQIKKSNQVTVGFAAETESSDKQMIAAASAKIDKKNLDLILIILSRAIKRQNMNLPKIISLKVFLIM
jgi:phosphopantothenoylcysteine decarboxylase/phosphopantothenate--cysteine ligase